MALTAAVTLRSVNVPVWSTSPDIVTLVAVPETGRVATVWGANDECYAAISRSGVADDGHVRIPPKPSPKVTVGLSANMAMVSPLQASTTAEATRSATSSAALMVRSPLSNVV